jgi:predicted amidohydrolase
MAKAVQAYAAVGLSPTVRGVLKREQIKTNIEHIHEVCAAACWLSSLALPVKLIVIPEGALQGFTDEVFDWDHEKYANEIAIDIPGPETEMLGKIAQEFNCYLVATAKAREAEFPGLFFNSVFLLSPRGKVILRHRKNSPLFPVEHSVCPHDVWDKWIKIHGRTLEAFFPVADTDIGKIGICMANEGSYPELMRGLAMNGAEVICRPAYPEPHVGNGAWEIQNRARALDNTCYMVAPNLGTYYLLPDSPLPVDTFGGHSMIVDYRGIVVARHDYGAGSSYCGGVIDIEALREFRARSPLMNWMKDLRTEVLSLIYEQPIYPKNLWLNRKPMQHAEYNAQVLQRQIRLMQERGIFTPPRGEAQPAVQTRTRRKTTPKTPKRRVR